MDKADVQDKANEEGLAHLMRIRTKLMRKVSTDEESLIHFMRIRTKLIIRTTKMKIV